MSRVRVELVFAFLFGLLIGLVSGQALPLFLKLDTELLSIVTGILGLLVSVALFLRTIKKFPKSLQVAVFGLSASGKTTFLASLLSAVEGKAIKGLRFLPGRRKTWVHWGRLADSVSSRILPPITSSGAVWPVDLIVSAGKRKRSHLQLLDFSGEDLSYSIEDYQRSPARKKAHFDALSTIEKVDALFLMVDSSELLPSEGGQARLYQRKVLELLYGVIEASTLDPTESVKKPLALIFTKSDRLNGLQESEILAQASLLVATCQDRFPVFRVFFVSALGEEPGEFPFKISPIGVLDPVLWLLLGRDK